MVSFLGLILSLENIAKVDFAECGTFKGFELVGSAKAGHSRDSYGSIFSHNQWFYPLAETLV